MNESVNVGPAPAMRPGSAGLLPAYYLLATPAFALLDVGGGPALRVPGLPGLLPRMGYYALLLLLGWIALRSRRAAPWVGMGESVVNLFLLFLSILLPIWSLPELVLAEGGGGAADAGLSTPVSLVNAALSGSVLIWSFHAHKREAFRSLHGS